MRPRQHDDSRRSISRRRFAAALAFVVAAPAILIAGDNGQQTFAKEWRGRTVVLRQTIYTIVYNERGTLGNTSSKRDGLTVATPSEGVFLQFDGRQGRDEVVERDPSRVLDAVRVMYEPDMTEFRSYRKIEPVVVVRHDPGGHFVVKDVRFDRMTLRVFLSEAGADNAEPVTSLTVQWPVQISKSFSERTAVEGLIRRFLDFADVSQSGQIVRR